MRKYVRRFIIVCILVAGCYALIVVVQNKRRAEQRTAMDIRAPERSVRLIEGWTLKEMDKYLAQEGVFPAGDFIATAERILRACRDEVEKDKANDTFCELFGSMPGKSVSLEGYLFPDTYRLYLDATPEDLINKMLANFQNKISEPQLQKMIADSGTPLHEILTMASIVESEVPHVEDRPVVAGIFQNRLDAGMPLQADSTVNYVTGKHDRAVSLDDTKTDSYYNTYLYPGLPPGPISNPGLSAIKAALNPKDSPYWFFLSAKDGTTIFSKNLQEHVAAKQKYLK